MHLLKRQNLHSSWLFRVAGVAVACVLLLSGSQCRKTIDITGGLPVWEDQSPDSATLYVHVQNNMGLLVYGQYVNLALSKDSLNRSILVRTGMTDGTGRATFSKLYPGTYYLNCFSNASQSIGYVCSQLSLFPQQIKDTLLILQ